MSVYRASLSLSQNFKQIKINNSFSHNFNLKTGDVAKIMNTAELIKAVEKFFNMDFKYPIKLYLKEMLLVKKENKTKFLSNFLMGN